MASPTSPPPKVLTVAGSDPSGGAGIEADLKVITTHRCYGMTCITSVTVQNTTGVSSVHLIPPDTMSAALSAVLDDIPPDVIKTGMLPSSDHIYALAAIISMQEREFPLVIDPVMVSSTGHRLIPKGVVKVFVELLLPKATVLTPNYPEALSLLEAVGREHSRVQNLEDLKSLARAVQTLGSKWVLVKGGHCPMDMTGTVAVAEDQKVYVFDVLTDGDEVYVARTNYLATRNTHGTGCSLASAIASNLAHKKPMRQSVREACAYVAAAIRTAPGFGHGKGPIDHLHSTLVSSFPKRGFVSYLLSHPKIALVWEKYIHHPFVLALGRGDLPQQNFHHYLVQDYLYLVHFARAHALAASKCTNMADITRLANIIGHIAHETKLHVSFCHSFGVSSEQLEAAEEALANTAYSRYVLDIGHSGDVLALYIALAPCLIGYLEAAKWLVEMEKKGEGGVKKEGNSYWRWVEQYTAGDYVDAVREGRLVIEAEAERQGLGHGVEKLEMLVGIFRKATELEVRFWEMGEGREL